MIDFISGASALACCVIALFFLRFWRQSGDRLFALFSLAFWAFAVNRLVITAVDSTSEGTAGLYLIRLLAFGLIIAAIVDKNRAGVLGRRADGRRKQRV